MSIERDGRSDRTVDSALVAPRSPHRVAACGERLLFGYLDGPKSWSILLANSS
jgi:hypothetical protein